MKPGNELSNFLDETEANNEPSQASSESELDPTRDETNRNKYEDRNETGIFQLNYVTSVPKYKYTIKFFCSIWFLYKQ